jgi:hypothetical protein
MLKPCCSTEPEHHFSFFSHLDQPHNWKERRIFMNFFVILAIIGGILYLINSVIAYVGALMKFSKKYLEYKNAYLDKQERELDEKPSMGFKTKEQEKKEAEMRLSNRTRS